MCGTRLLAHICMSKGKMQQTWRGVGRHSLTVCPAPLFYQEFHNVEEAFGRGQVQGPVSNFSAYIDISTKLQKDTGYLKESIIWN